jgi:HEAT repeat protein
MKGPTLRYFIRPSCLLCLAGWSFAGYSAEISAAGPAENEAGEIQRIRQRLEDGSLPEPPTWTLIHMAAEKEKAEALQVFCSGKPDEQKSAELAEIIRKGGGLQKYRERIAGLLDSRDATVRGFAAVWLADLGGQAYAKQILALLQSENLPDAGGFNKNWDRGMAAFALGVLGAKEHTNVLAKFLRHEDRHVRAGAVAGLARLKAKEYDKEISALLRDDDPSVVCAAIAALAELDAKQSSDRIAALLQANDVEIPNAALTALVMLDAKEQAPRVANLLKDRFKRGQAAKTLALLGSDKYTQDIAELLNVEEPLTRADALVAMGILRASRYAPEVARHMHDKEDFVRHAAAWAIVMMEAEAYTAEAAKIQRAAQQEKLSPLGSGERGIPRDRLRQLKERFAKNLARLNGTRP